MTTPSRVTAYLSIYCSDYDQTYNENPTMGPGDMSAELLYYTTVLMLYYWEQLSQETTVILAFFQGTYGWNSPGREPLLDECHQNVCTLGLLTRSVLIEIAWGFLHLVKNCHGKDDIKEYQ